jgi:hypothetical protein
MNGERIMHHQSQLADLVDLLAVDFDIVDTTGRRREARGWRKTLIRKATQQSLGRRLGLAQRAAPILGDRWAVFGK